ncbi:NACHT domain-containing protein [Methylobacterium sp. UNC300MFChir4.1]|uniref:NACHT domain-containing protein n=1 Tax=Methylobacterium sp. UNC300MFChir4.1 TaxID=1502747 RepID=UPI0008CF0DEF|nr:NACHT domain-containing protein [Methylobacterium sp. UNC300MFChir4.1]SEO19181.1 NACHT domain-containing protein [Methylobacterium sp. UNC300MFChir4.1]
MDSGFFTGIVASAFKKLAEQQITKGVNASPQVLSRLWDKIRSNFSQHLEDSYRKYSTVRTVLNRDEAMQTLKIYTSTLFASAGEQCTDEDLLDKVLEGSRCCVIGTGGCGKSMFMRYLLLNLIENEKNKIPIVCELRQLNSLESKDIVSFLHYSVNKNDGFVSLEVFKNVLKEGSFVIILDGFDEIDFNHRTSVERNIIELSERYPKVSVVVSSRPDDRFSSWTDFRIWHVRPMEIDQVIDLIESLNYDNEVKKKFIKAVRGGLYIRHRSFMSNPLLATIMLLTYDLYPNIPDKIHLFYHQAFETLFSLHDSSKQPGYQRKMYTQLASDAFKNCFSIACITSYVNEKFTFTEEELKKHIQQALKLENHDVESNLFIKDLIESVCIMQKEGLHISFTHRSFQEYFAAHFISRGSFKDISKLADNIVRRQSDNALIMAYDMNSALLEREWILPKLRELNDEILKIDNPADESPYLRIVFGDIAIHYIQAEQAFRFHIERESNWSSFTRYITQIYNQVFDAAKQIDLDGKANLNQSIVEEMRRRKILPKSSLPETTSRGTMRKPIIIDKNVTPWLQESQLATYARWHRDGLKAALKLAEKNVNSREKLAEILKFEPI